jgi:hypothetical protein
MAAGGWMGQGDVYVLHQEKKKRRRIDAAEEETIRSLDLLASLPVRRTRGSVRPAVTSCRRHGFGCAHRCVSLPEETDAHDGPVLIQLSPCHGPRPTDNATCGSCLSPFLGRSEVSDRAAARRE